jgi:hypothetical protein
MRNETVEEGLFKITSVMGLYNVFGIKNVLEILHPQSVTTLVRSIKPYIIDKIESTGDTKVISFINIMLNNLCVV